MGACLSSCAGLWLYPMVKAFRCDKNGLIWGAMIFLFPLLGPVYLLVGCPKAGAAMLTAETTGENLGDPINLRHAASREVT